jgi:hypothetical protein
MYMYFILYFVAKKRKKHKVMLFMGAKKEKKTLSYV